MGAKASKIADELSTAAGSHLREHGGKLIEAHEESATLLVTWLGHLRHSAKTGTANQLLDGLQATVIEVSGCLALGLVRPAIFALRAQVDILFAWLFFKDHPVEWGHVESTGQRYRLVTDAGKYLKSYFPRYEERLKLLRKNRSGGEQDPYALLSAHVHGQNTATIPPLVRVPELVQMKGKCDECIALQGEIAEYLSDVLVALHADEWADLPQAVRESLESRLSKPKLKDLCIA